MIAENQEMDLEKILRELPVETRHNTIFQILESSKICISRIFKKINS